MRQPPRLATWLLNRLDCGNNVESLLGDLVESYRQGRSDAWYWRQVLRAVLTSACHHIRSHKLLALRAIVVGYVVSEALAYSTGALVSRFVAGDKALLILLPLCGGCSAAGGWVVSRSYPRRWWLPTPPSVGPLLFAYSWCMACSPSWTASPSLFLRSS